MNLDQVLGRLRHRSEQKKKIPDADADLHAVRVVLAVVLTLGGVDFRLLRMLRMLWVSHMELSVVSRQ